MRLIDADEMLFELTHWKDNKRWYHDNRTDVYHISEIEMVCDRMPIIEAEPERKKGEWILKPNIYGVAYCSECDYELHTDNTNYCPNCGADMRGEQNG